MLLSRRNGNGVIAHCISTVYNNTACNFHIAIIMFKAYLGYNENNASAIITVQYSIVKMCIIIANAFGL